jgi:hypothetical protein
VAAYRDLDAVMFDWTRSNVTASGSLSGGYAARILADDMLSAYAAFAGRNEQAASSFAASLDNWKTLSRQAERNLRKEAETTEDEAYRGLIETYFNAFGRFREIVTASLFSAELAPLQQEMEQARLALNEARADRGLPEITPWFRSERAKFVPAIEPDEGDVIIDLAVTRQWARDRSGDPLAYEVYAVISRHGKPDEVVHIHTIELGEAQPTFEDEGRELTTKLVSTLLQAGEGARAVYLIPDDFLFQWPLAEQRTEDGRRLGEAIDLHFATSRQAYAFRAKHDRFGEEKSALLVGGLIYDAASQSPELPASLMEVEAISALSRASGRSVELMTERDATEARVRAAASSHSVLHFATHGFFRSDAEASACLYKACFSLSIGELGGGYEEVDDNIVYAREILGWNLRRTDLVVIAACETALGDLGLTATVRGLPLALSVAGARRSLLTIDAVPDRATANFMIRYYEHLTREGMDYAKAFIATKRDAWAGNIEDFPPDLTYAYVLFEH